MRPWQNALAILATFLVAGGLLPWRYRLACAIGAIGIVLLLAVFRIGAHRIKREQADTEATYARIERIRAERKQRFGYDARGRRRREDGS